jgi:hypothetical protein
LEILVGLVLIFSALVKALELPVFITQIAYYRLLPQGWEPAVAVFIVLAEAGLGLALAVGLWRRGAFHAAAALLLIFLSGVFIFGLAERAIEECGCFGTIIRLDPWVSLVKNAVLLIMIGAAVALRRGAALPAPSGRLQWLRPVTVALAAFLTLSSLAWGIVKEIHESRAKESILSGPIDPDRPYARFNFQADGRRWDLGQGDYFVAWLSTTCDDCKAAAEPLDELPQMIPELPPIIALGLGDQTTFKQYREETDADFPFVLVPARVFLQFVEVEPPRFVLVREGRPLHAWDGSPPDPMELAEEVYSLPETEL